MNKLELEIQLSVDGQPVCQPVRYAAAVELPKSEAEPPRSEELCAMWRHKVEVLRAEAECLRDGAVRLSHRLAIAEETIADWQNRADRLTSERNDARRQLEEISAIKTSYRSVKSLETENAQLRDRVKVFGELHKQEQAQIIVLQNELAEARCAALASVDQNALNRFQAIYDQIARDRDEACKQRDEVSHEFREEIANRGTAESLLRRAVHTYAFFKSDYPALFREIRDWLVKNNPAHPGNPR
jgi:chromosome segregation ATPase